MRLRIAVIAASACLALSLWMACASASAQSGTLAQGAGVVAQGTGAITQGTGAITNATGGIVTGGGLTGPAPEGMDAVLREARDASKEWMERMTPTVWSVFLGLALIDLVLLLGKATITGELHNVMDALIQFGLRKGFWAFVIISYSTLIPSVVLSLHQVGLTASSHLGSGISAQRLMNAVGELARVQTEGMSSFNVLRSAELLLAILLVFVSSMLLAGFSWLAWFRAYVVMGAGKIMVGFAGSRFSEDMAVRSLQYSVSAGIHLMVNELLQGLFFKYLCLWIETAQKDTNFGLQTAMVIVGSAVAMVIALISVPGFCASIAHGGNSHVADAALMAATVKALSAAAGAAGAAISKLDDGVSKLASALSSGGGTPGASGVAVSVSEGNSGSSSGASLGPGAGAPPAMGAGGPNPGALGGGDNGNAPRLGPGAGAPPSLGGGDSGAPQLGSGGGGGSPRLGSGGGGGGGGSPRLRAGTGSGGGSRTGAKASAQTGVGGSSADLSVFDSGAAEADASSDDFVGQPLQLEADIYDQVDDEEWADADEWIGEVLDDGRGGAHA